MKKLNSGYIISVVSAVLLLLEVIGVKVDMPYVNEVVMAVLGVLVALGLVTGKGSQPKGDNSTGGGIVSDEDIEQELLVGDESDDKTDDGDEIAR